MSQNGQTTQESDQIMEAMEYEREIAEEAEKIWEELEDGQAVEMPQAVFLKLWPLLKKPIPQGFIVTTEAVKGKPYPSTGVKSLQVFIDRMNNVLTPLFWGWETEYNEDGTLATVTVRVGAVGQEAILIRRSTGGVNQASTTGNRYKGSETNAAKRAFAAIGVGHEVYLGASDFDPDTDEDAAAAQQTTLDIPDPARKLPAEKVKALEQAVKAAGLDEHLPMRLRGFGVEAVSDLTVEQAVSVYEWCQQEVASG